MRRIGEYELIKKIGAGGMGQVWMGQRTVLGGTKQVVAIKLLSDQHGNVERQRELFIREARISLSLNHSNIVRVSDAGEADGQAYMVMEWVDGLTVGQLLKALTKAHQVLSLRVVTYVVGEVLRALAYAQTVRLEAGSQGVIHRDISPQNVLVSVSGEVKLVDFGVARVVAEETSGELRGKLGYLAPEQLRGGKLDARVDLYAVGVLLHELADGARFRKARDHNHMYGLVMSGEILPLSRTQLPKELEALRVALLQPDPADRIVSAEAAFEMLRSWSGYGDASLELAKLVRTHAGVDAPRSGVHAAAAVSGSMPAASAPGDITRTRTTKPDAVPAETSGPTSEAETQTQVERLPVLAAQVDEGQGRGGRPFLGVLVAVLLLGVAGSLFAFAMGQDASKVESPALAAREENAAPREPRAEPKGEPEPEVSLEPEPEPAPETEPKAEPKPEPAKPVKDEAEAAAAVAAEQPSKAAAPRPKPKALPPATVTLHAGSLNWAYVKIAGRRHLIEPLKKGVRLKAGSHAVYVSTEAGGKGAYRRAGRIEVDAGGRYELRFHKSPLGLVLSPKR